MRERLEKVLNRLVVPINDRLDYARVSSLGIKGKIVVITYYILDRIDYQDAFEIERETRNMFEMLSPDKDESFVIRYEISENFT